jgi:uncharacterized C2H2 Zn-finger protein
MADIPVTCPSCGALFGRMVQVNGVVRLDAAGWIISDGYRHCHRCGHVFHFKPPKAPWPELVRRAEKRQGQIAQTRGQPV